MLFAKGWTLVACPRRCQNRPFAKSAFYANSNKNVPITAAKDASTGRFAAGFALLSYTKLAENRVQQLFLHLIAGDFRQGALGGSKVNGA